MASNRLPKLAVALLLVAAGQTVARAEKPPKIPVTFGAWKGPHATTFRSGLRRGMKKSCTVVHRKAARAVINGEVNAKGKRYSVRVIVMTPKTDEIVESREYFYSRPRISRAQADRMGRQVTDMARRAPTG